MTSNQRICTDAVGHMGRGRKFELIVLDSWDGPTRGVLRCTVCLAEMLVDVIDWQEYDEREDIRIAAVSALRRGTAESLVKVFPKKNPVSRPIWTPVWQFDSPGEEKRACDAIDSWLGHPGKPKMLIAWRGGWTMEIFLAKALDVAHARLVQKSLLGHRRKARPIDWFGYVGLPR